MTKECTKCKQVRDIKHFNKRPLKNSIGYRSQCKYCESTTATESYHRRKEKNVELEKMNNRLNKIKLHLDWLAEKVADGCKLSLEHEDVEMYIELIEMVEGRWGK